MKPFYENIQAHYDLSNEFFALFLDPTRTYSCAYFEPDALTLEQAQIAKMDLALGKCDLPAKDSDNKPLRLLDVGCGWGGTLKRATETYNVEGVGLTLSKNQHAYASELLADRPVEIRLQGWEEFNEPVDRIVSIGAFEHFRTERYQPFFDRCHSILPDGGSMLLHTIVRHDIHTLRKQGIEVAHEHILFTKFIQEHIFPGSHLCPPDMVTKRAKNAGFELTRVQPLQLHYAKTLDIWWENLQAKREEAIALTSQENYDIYERYLTGCAKYFRSGHIDVMQFSLTKA